MRPVAIVVLLAAIAGAATAGPADAAPQVSLPVRLLFAVVDANADGRVTRDEGRVLADRIFDQADLDRDGAVSSTELEAGARRFGADPNGANEARTTFRQIDRNRDGRVSATEWNARVASEFAGLDANRDGVITLADLSGRDLRVPQGALGVMAP